MGQKELDTVTDESRLRKFLPERFFTDRVVSGREGASPPTKEKHQPAPAQPVKRFLLGGRDFVVIGLEKSTKDGEYRFRLGGDVNLIVPRGTLVNATGHISQSPRVQIAVGTERLCLDRAQLAAAFKKLG